MMSEAGQIFALLRASSAAELAKRFNSWGDGSTPGAGYGPGGAGDGNPTNPASPGGTSAPAGKGAAGALASLLTASPPAPVGSSPDPGAADPVGQAAISTLRPAASLGHLAAPRSDLTRLVASNLLSGLSRGEATGAAAGSGSGAALANAALGLSASGAGGGDPAGEVLAALALALGAVPEADVGSATKGPPSAGQGNPEGMGPFASAGADQVTMGAGKPGTATAATVASAREVFAGEPAAGQVGQGQGAGDPGSQAPARTAGAAQAAVFAEAVAVLLDTTGSSKAGTVASGIIFNAAMMPGWPFPSAMAKDGADAVNPKAMLHRLAAAMEGMTPQQAAEYMAKIGGGHVLLRTLRKILKELDMTGKDEVKGLLLAFLETISTIAAGLQSALQQMTESAALQAAVVHGEDSDDGGDRPGRRRLRL